MPASAKMEALRRLLYRRALQAVTTGIPPRARRGDLGLPVAAKRRFMDLASTIWMRRSARLPVPHHGTTTTVWPLSAISRKMPNTAASKRCRDFPSVRRDDDFGTVGEAPAPAHACR